MQERVYSLIYKLDFIDLNILEQIIINDYSITLDTLVNRLKKVNVWNKGTIRNRVHKLREWKVLHFESKTSPLIIEIYQHKEKEVELLKNMLKKRLVR